MISEMAEKTSPLAISLSFAKAPPQAIDAAAAFGLSLTASCPEGFQLAGGTYRILEGETSIQEGDLPVPGEAGVLPFSAPAHETTGEHRFHIIIASAPYLRGERSEGALAFAFE